MLPALCKMVWDLLVYFFSLATVVTARPSVCGFELVSREAWGARPPVLVEPMKNPVPFVIIHHSYQPPACNTTTECMAAMRRMQDLHQINNGWNDIGYSFAVGSDGKAYVGRGWHAVGAHAPTYNDKSIGICLIGDWRYDVPPKHQLETVRRLIECGIATGTISPDYALFGHRQVREGTECPGDALFEEITTWKHFNPAPPHRWRENVVPT